LAELKSYKNIELSAVPINTSFFILGSCLVINACIALYLPSADKLKNPKYASDQRFSREYALYISSLIFTGAVVPVVLIAQSTNGYLLQRFADIEATEINHRKKVVITQLSDYKSIFTLPNESTHSHGDAQACQIANQYTRKKSENDQIIDFFKRVNKEKQEKTLFTFYQKYYNETSIFYGL
jgi:hypothetical protein